MAVTVTKPENFIRLTMDTTDPQRLVEAVAGLRRWWRRRVGDWEDAYVIEPNPRGTGLHLHGWQHGSAVDRGDLESAAEAAGFLPGPYGRPRTLPDGASLDYFLKTAIYPAALRMPPRAERFLELNQYMVNKTRGFLRDGEGRTVSSMAEAVRLARETPKRRLGRTTLE